MKNKLNLADFQKAFKAKTDKDDKLAFQVVKDSVLCESDNIHESIVKIWNSDKLNIYIKLKCIFTLGAMHERGDVEILRVLNGKG